MKNEDKIKLVPKYKKGDIIYNGEYSIVVTSAALYEGRMIYRGTRVIFAGELLMSETEVLYQITESEDMYEK